MDVFHYNAETVHTIERNADKIGLYELGPRLELNSVLLGGRPAYLLLYQSNTEGIHFICNRLCLSDLCVIHQAFFC